MKIKEAKLRKFLRSHFILANLFSVELNTTVINEKKISLKDFKQNSPNCLQVFRVQFAPNSGNSMFIN